MFDQGFKYLILNLRLQIRPGDLPGLQVRRPRLRLGRGAAGRGLQRMARAAAFRPAEAGLRYILYCSVVFYCEGYL